jgi:hypothetical protein
MATIRDSERLVWNVVERSAGGHERSRRLEWRMTEEEALEWQRANARELIRAAECQMSDETAGRRDARAQYDADVD